MPYDTGFMSLAGAKYIETNTYILVRYDTERVPYIVYNEEGTIYTQVNKGFIREKTVGDLMRHAYYRDNGMRLPFSKLDERVKRRASTNMIGAGALEKIKGER